MPGSLSRDFEGWPAAAWPISIRASLTASWIISFAENVARSRPSTSFPMRPQAAEISSI
jgi:hypothetical protein